LEKLNGPFRDSLLLDVAILSWLGLVNVLALENQYQRAFGTIRGMGKLLGVGIGLKTIVVVLAFKFIYSSVLWMTPDTIF
jgi:hypothetical protein